MQVQSSMPHELLGYEKTDVGGILLSMEIVAEVNRQQEKMAKNPKRAAQAGRQRKAMAKSGKGRPA